MRVVRKFFCEFDMFEAPASFRIREEPQMKTFTIGFLSFVLACFFFYVFVDSTVKMFNYQKISYSESTTTIRSEDANGTFSKFAISLDFMNIYDFQTMFQFKVYIFKKGEFSRQVPMRPCIANDWIALGNNYQQEFKSYYLGSMMCPNTDEQFFMNETFRSDTSDFLKIVLTACSTTTNPSCNPTDAADFLYNQSMEWNSVEIWVYVLDKSISPDSQKPINYFINIDTKVYVTSKFGGAAVIEFSTFKIKTDTTVMPWEDINTQSGCRVDSVRNYQIDFTNAQTDTLAVIKFTMNQRQYIINRVVGKIDNLLSYAGGLFSIIIGFLALFLKSFNEYKYELTVAEGAFNYDKKGNKIKEQHLNFWVYIKYTIYDWIHVLFCYELSWKDCRQIDATREQIISCLQTDKFFRRVNNLQKAVRYCMNRDQNKCLHILSLPDIQDIKHDRLALQYYDKITKDRCGTTLCEVRVGQDGVTIQIESMPSSKINRVGNEDSKIDFSIAKSNININLSQIQQENVRHNNYDQEDRIELIPIVLQNYPELKKQSELIVLDDQFQEIEKQIGASFWRMQPKVRVYMQEQVPILILHRLLQIKNSN